MLTASTMLLSSSTIRNFIAARSLGARAAGTQDSIAHFHPFVYRRRGRMAGAPAVLRPRGRSLAGPRGKPGVDARPGALDRATPGHDADVPAGHAQQLLVGAAHFLQDSLRLAGRR